MLKKLKDFYPDYKDMPSGQGFDLDEIKDFEVYAQDDKVGSIDDVLVDIEDGRFRYYIVDTGFWIFGKKILLPVGLGRINADEKKIYVNNLTKEQVEDLPNFDDLEKVDFDQEEQIRGIYRSGSIVRDRQPYEQNSYQYDHDPDLYNLSEQEHQSRISHKRLSSMKKESIQQINR